MAYARAVEPRAYAIRPYTMMGASAHWIIHEPCGERRDGDLRPLLFLGRVHRGASHEEQFLTTAAILGGNGDTARDPERDDRAVGGHIPTSGFRLPTIDYPAAMRAAVRARSSQR